MTFSSFDCFPCPHCNHLTDDPAEDYVVPGRVGPHTAVKEHCESCCVPFTVYKNDVGAYVVTKLES